MQIKGIAVRLASGLIYTLVIASLMILLNYTGPLVTVTLCGILPTHVHFTVSPTFAVTVPWFLAFEMNQMSPILTVFVAAIACHCSCRVYVVMGRKEGVTEQERE